jgi:hypothetical protein
MQIINTDTWEVLYTLSGGIVFSPGGRYIAYNDHEGYDDVQLIEAHTGRAIDAFLGTLSFTRDERYWIRGEALDYDARNWQVIDLATNEIIFQHNGYRGPPVIYDDNTVSMWNFVTQSTPVFDLATGELIREIDGVIERFGNAMIVSSLMIDQYSTPFSYLQNWETSETYAIGRQIKMTPGGKLALVSNGLFIDVYAPDGTEIEGMPPPRPIEGIARSDPGEIALFSVPDSDNPRIVVDGALLNPTYFIVLGKTDAPGWIFVSFLNSGINPERLQGWIRSDGLGEVVSWEDVPVLNADDPIAQLRSIAFASHE